MSEAYYSLRVDAAAANYTRNETALRITQRNREMHLGKYTAKDSRG
jgi:hypothetical protein